MGDVTGRAPGARTGDLDGGAHRAPSLGVHLLAGLPTDAVRRGFARAREVIQVVPLEALGEVVVGDAKRIGVLLPPFVEPTAILESWMECDFLSHCFARPAHIAGVSAFVDVAHALDHLSSATPLSAHGWGRSGRDGRSVADILVGQIESATHLVLVGASPAPDSLARCLTVLNPGVSSIPLSGGSPRDLRRLAAALGADDRGARSAGRGTAPGRCPDRPRSDSREARSEPVVPPWLRVLRGEVEPAPGSGLHIYRRARPFDPTRLGRWLAHPPKELVRGKGLVWLSGEPDQSFGYSCAGSVHRLFPAGRWWASCTDGPWPSCAAQRRKLLERWHPRFGDRRQEIVFAGVGLDAGRLCAELDACLLGEEAVDDSLHPPRGGASERSSKPGARFH